MQFFVLTMVCRSRMGKLKTSANWDVAGVMTHIQLLLEVVALLATSCEVHDPLNH